MAVPYWQRRLKVICAYILGLVSFQVVMFLLTVYALVGEDIRVSATHSPADLVFNIVTIVALVLFAFELVANVVATEDYFLGFFFWLDLVATASLILDITWVYSALTGTANDSSIARAGRMSKVGSRAGRVLRVIRLIRLIRIIKLYKHVLFVRQRMQGKAGDHLQPGQEGNDNEEGQEQSRVGSRLSELTTQKVIILILCMLIIVPNMRIDVWFSELPASAQYGADVVNRAWLLCNYSMPSSCQSFEQQLMMYISYHHRRKVTNCDDWVSETFKDCRLDIAYIGRIRDREVDKPFSGFEFRDFRDYWDAVYKAESTQRGQLPDAMMDHINAPWRALSCDKADYFELLLKPVGCPLDELRAEETLFVSPSLVDVAVDSGWVFVFDLRPFTLRSAVYNMIQTAFVCCMLTIGAWLFSKDAHELVLVPIERMVSKVHKIKDNPLYAMRLGDDEYRQQQEEENKRTDEKQGGWSRFRRCCRRKKDTKVTLETQILENAIIKLGKLLALGFGEAGSEIIGRNMQEDSATVNAMIRGSKVEAVFGQCDILHFTDTTEVLQDKVMVFVNQVAEIVHQIVDSYLGAANRNIGDAFLIVWRMRKEYDVDMKSKMADMSAISMVSIMAAVSKSAVMKEYREHPGLLARMSNYSVRLAFGLHYGWAIEGAIGSEFKIDASYISPHVNVVSRLATATRAYKVGLIMSQPLVSLCSKEMNSYIRTIDRVTLLKGTREPLKLFTIDLHPESLLYKETDVGLARAKKAKNPFELRMQRDKAKEEKRSISFKVHTLLATEPDLKKMREGFPQRFFDLFTKGYLNYEAGEWDVARVVFEQTRKMLGRIDGPSQSLLDFMASFDFESGLVDPPKGWPGHRKLPGA